MLAYYYDVIAAGSAGAWTPASLPGMAAGRSGWWTYTAGLPSVASPVDSWTASAGTLGALTSTGASRPVMQADGPHADGVDDYLRIAGISPTLPVNDWAAWIVITPDQDLTGWYLSAQISGSSGLTIRRLATLDQVRATLDGTTANDTTDINATPVDTPISVLVTRDSTTGIKAYIDGTEFLSDADTTNNAAWSQLDIFQRDLGGWTGGTAHDVGFHDGALSASELTELQTYLETIRAGV